MSESDYSSWFETSVREYADEHIKAGNFSPEDGLQRARSEFESYLPSGRFTKDHFLYSIVNRDSHEKAGMIWFAINLPGRPTMAFIFDIRIDEGFRGEGYGTAAMLLLEEKVRALGKKRIELHVFGHNHGARKLYERLGYVPTDILMAKNLND